MYNRYIRNDRGTYTRITEDDGTPRRPSSAPPPEPSEPPPPPLPNPPPPEMSGRPPEPPPPGAPHRPPPDVSHRPPPPQPPIHDGFLRHLLDVSRLENVDTGDLLLLCLLFLLYREGADEELLVALGLLLIL